MKGTIITVTISYYIFAWLLSFGGPHITLQSFNLLAMLPAGIVGGIQFASTERRGLRWPRRLLCAFQSNVFIIIAPGLVWMFFALPMLILGMGLPALALLPSLATILTINWALGFLVTFLLAIPTIFVGFTLGQWFQFRRMVS